MTDNRETAREVRVIAGFEAHATEAVIGPDRIHVWCVVDLERHVDRAALLEAVDPPEPPYWAHCWSGARVLAERVPTRAGRVLEIGCGVGLPGLVAARRGGSVVFLDRVSTPLQFVAASLATNRLAARGVVVGDALHPPWRARFDLVLAAEVVYDRMAFAALAQRLARSVEPAGRVLLADGHRIDTRAFYDEARQVGFECAFEDVRVVEEGITETVTIVTMSLDDRGRTC